jgi:hypothetical protein
MADDIGGRGEDPRDVARRRIRQGIRRRAAESVRNQPSGPTATPPTQAVTPYRERLPAAGSGGGGGGAGDGGGGRGMTPSAGANPPSGGGEGGSRSMTSETRPTIRVPPGSAEALRRGAGLSGGAAPSRLSRAAGPAAGAAMAVGLGLEALRRYREGRGEQPITGNFETGMEPEGTQEAADAMRQAAGPMPTPPIPPRRARPAARESMTADDLNAIVLKLNRGAVPQTEVERRLADRMGIAYRKGGLVKPKKFQVGGPVKVPGKTPRVGGPKPPARMRDRISAEERKELDAPLTRAEKDRMAENGFKKGGAIKAPVKKMKVGGKVPAPKKMMKGGMVAKPKAKMAKYAKGGMAKGKK